MRRNNINLALVLLLLAPSCGKTSLPVKSESAASRGLAAGSDGTEVPLSASVGDTNEGIGLTAPSIQYKMKFVCTVYGTAWSKVADSKDLIAGTVTMPKDAKNCYAYMTELQVKPSGASAFKVYVPNPAANPASLFQGYKSGASEVYSISGDSTSAASVVLSAPFAMGASGGQVGYRFSVSDVAVERQVNLELAYKGTLTVNGASNRVSGIASIAQLRASWTSLNTSSCLVSVQHSGGSSLPLTISNGPTSNVNGTSFGPLAVGSYIAKLRCVVLGKPYDLAQVIIDVVDTTLTVSRSGNGSGTVSGTGIQCGSDCREAYPFGQVVTLVSTPSVDSIFTGWSGACTGAGACTVTMSGARSVTANFIHAPGPLFARVSIGFEDSTDNDFNDIGVCFTGSLRQQGSSIVAASDQTISFKLTRFSRFDHLVAIKIFDINGNLRKGVLYGRPVDFFQVSPPRSRGSDINPILISADVKAGDRITVASSGEFGVISFNDLSRVSIHGGICPDFGN